MASQIDQLTRKSDQIVQDMSSLGAELETGERLTPDQYADWVKKLGFTQRDITWVMT